jgi:uncharacterized membrane protein
MSEQTPTPATTYKSSDQDESGWLPEGRGVEAGQGWTWISEGFSLFMKNPLIWIVITVLLAVIMIVLNFIPFLGQLAGHLLTPVFGAGLMLGCQALRSGGALEVTHLFEGFKQRTSELIVLGLLYMVGVVIIGVAVFAVVGGSVMSGLMMGHRGGAGVAVGGVMLGALLALALFVPLAMATWFATPLVLFNKLAPIDAMKASFFACLKNIVPFLVYGVILFVLGVVAAIPFGLGFLVLIPVLIGSVYTSYRDVFYQ